MNMIEAGTLLDAGKLQMRRPWGDYVPIRRRGTATRKTRVFADEAGQITTIPVYMEGSVEASITLAMCVDRLGLRDLKVLP